MSTGHGNFDRVAAEYDATRGGVERARTAARDVAGHLPGGDALEIGVGTGIVAEALLQEAPQLGRLAGIDVSAQMLIRARPRLLGRLVRGSAERLPFPDGRFDAVVAVHVLHLVPDLAVTLIETARVLRPGGLVVAIHGEPQHQDDDLTRATRSLEPLISERPDAPAEVRATAERAGLSTVAQHPSSPRVTGHTPAELAGLLERRSWSHLWELDDEAWRSHVEPAIAALRALPDQDRVREQSASRTVTVLLRD